MKGSISIRIENNSLFLVKNKGYKYLLLLLSLIAETGMLYLLISGFYPAINKNKGRTIFLFVIIFIAYTVFVFFSVRKFLKDIDYIVTRDDKLIIVNGAQRFDAGLSLIVVKKNVNRWGTPTFNILIQQENKSIEFVNGIDEKEKDNVVNALESFLRTNNTLIK